MAKLSVGFAVGANGKPGAAPPGDAASADLSLSYDNTKMTPQTTPLSDVLETLKLALQSRGFR